MPYFNNISPSFCNGKQDSLLNSILVYTLIKPFSAYTTASLPHRRIKKNNKQLKTLFGKTCALKIHFVHTINKVYFVCCVVYTNILHPSNLHPNPTRHNMLEKSPTYSIILAVYTHYIHTHRRIDTAALKHDKSCNTTTLPQWQPYNHTTHITATQFFFLFFHIYFFPMDLIFSFIHFQLT